MATGGLFPRLKFSVLCELTILVLGITSLVSTDNATETVWGWPENNDTLFNTTRLYTPLLPADNTTETFWGWADDIVTLVNITRPCSAESQDNSTTCSKGTPPLIPLPMNVLLSINPKIRHTQTAGKEIRMCDRGKLFDPFSVSDNIKVVDPKLIWNLIWLCVHDIFKYGSE